MEAGSVQRVLGQEQESLILPQLYINCMVRLESERLFIYPLSDEEMRRLAEGEREPALKQAYSEMLSGCLREPESRVWHAVWAMELKSEPGTVVGDLSFKGLDADGAAELGYGLRKGRCGRGYMTEAVRALCAWALAQEGVTRIEAETGPDNAASQRVLSRAGFLPTGEIGEEGPRFALMRGGDDHGF